MLPKTHNIRINSCVNTKFGSLKVLNNPFCTISNFHLAFIRTLITFIPKITKYKKIPIKNPIMNSLFIDLKITN